jgi:hypothetical protein
MTAREIAAALGSPAKRLGRWFRITGERDQTVNDRC